MESSSNTAPSSTKETYLHLTQLKPHLSPHEIHLKVIVLERSRPQSSSTPEKDASHQHVLIGDETGCMNYMVRSRLIHQLLPGDIIKISGAQCILQKNQCMSLFGGKIERIGE